MKYVNVTLFKEMLNGGYLLVERNLNYINELNVFPVPDGDTGTNLKITIFGGIEKICSESFKQKNFFEIARTFARTLMFSARGNSGVIFSQIMSGFTSVFTEDLVEIDVSLFIKGFKLAKEVAYAAVVQPVEGTMLTVIRLIAEELDNFSSDNVEELFAKVVQIANETVEKTPEMLNDLKIAGVVDSGGFGLARFFEGMYAVLANKREIFTNNSANTNSISSLTKNFHPINEFSMHEFNDCGYCTEFLLNLAASNVNLHRSKKIFLKDKFIKAIQKYSSSVNVIHDEKEGLVRVHGHTQRPDHLLSEGIRYGEFINVKIENMSLQVSEKLRKKEMSKLELLDELSIVVVAPSDNLVQFINDNYGISNVINHQRTGNPSVKDFIQLFRSPKSKNVIALIYDSNTKMSAMNACSELKKNNLNVEVICVKNFIEILAACAAFDPIASLKTNIKAITKSVNSVASAAISQASRTVKYPHLFVEKGNFISLVNKVVKFKHTKRKELVKIVVESLIKRIKKPELLILVRGKNVESSSEVKELVNYFSREYGLYCKSIDGNQDVYDYFIGVQ